MSDRSNSPLTSGFSAFAAFASLLSITVGLSGLAGWAFHIPDLDTWGAAPVTMKVNTSACFVLIGVSLWLLRKKDNGTFARINKLTAKTTAAVVTLMGLLSLAEHLPGWYFSIDHL